MQIPPRLTCIFSFIPIAGPRYRRPKQPKDKTNDEKRPRTAFSSEQLARLKVSIQNILPKSIVVSYFHQNIYTHYLCRD